MIPGMTGRVIDYIQEDVDSMRKELLQWRSEYQEHAAALADQDRSERVEGRCSAVLVDVSGLTSLID